MVFEPQMPVIGPSRDSAQIRQLRKVQQKKIALTSDDNNNNDKNPTTGSPAVIGPGAMKLLRKPPLALGDYVTATVSSKTLMRQVSGLGMEDPVFRHIHSSLGGDRPEVATDEDENSDTSNCTAALQGRNHHPSNIFDDMSIGDVPEDMRDLVSIKCDKTAAGEDGIDVAYYEELMMTPYVDPSPEIEKLGSKPNEVMFPQARSNDLNHPKVLLASLCNVQLDPTYSPRNSVTSSLDSSQQHSDGNAALSNNRKIPSHPNRNQHNPPYQQHQTPYHAYHPAQPLLQPMNESGQSLDLDGVFGKDRVQGVPNLSSLNTNSYSTHNSQQPEQKNQQQVPASLLQSRKQLPEIPMTHRFSSQRQIEGGGSDNLLGESAGKLKQIAGAGNDAIIGKLLGESEPRQMDVIRKPSQLLRSGSYVSRESTSSRNQAASRLSSISISEHGRTVSPLRVSRMIHPMNNVQGAPGTLQPIPAKKKRDGPKKRSLPTIESIFPMDDPPQPKPATDEPRSISVKTSSLSQFPSDPGHTPISFNRTDNKLGQINPTEGLEMAPPKMIQDSSENDCNSGSSSRKPIALTPKLQASPASTAEMTASPELESTAISTSTVSLTPLVTGGTANTIQPQHPNKSTLVSHTKPPTPQSKPMRNSVSGSNVSQKMGSQSMSSISFSPRKSASNRTGFAGGLLASFRRNNASSHNPTIAD